MPTQRSGRIVTPSAPPFIPLPPLESQDRDYSSGAFPAFYPPPQASIISRKTAVYSKEQLRDVVKEQEQANNDSRKLQHGNLVPARGHAAQPRGGALDRGRH